MTKEEAKQALQKGKTVRHICFLENESICLKGKNIITSELYEIEWALFWYARNSEVFDTGWSVIT